MSIWRMWIFKMTPRGFMETRRTATYSPEDDAINSVYDAINSLIAELGVWALLHPLLGAQHVEHNTLSAQGVIFECAKVSCLSARPPL